MIDSHMRRAGAEVTLLALTRLPPVASPAWAATMPFRKLVNRVHDQKRQHGMGMQRLVMTTPATHKERFR